MNIITGNRNFLFLKYKLKRLIRLIVRHERIRSFGSDKDQLNKIFVINLDRQKERWRLIRKEIGFLKVDNEQNLLAFTERFSAVDAKNQYFTTDKVSSFYKLEDQYFVDPNPQLLNILRQKETNIELTKQEIAVALSHISVWEKIVIENIQNALILEDDIYFENNFSSKINSLWQEINDSKIEFDLLYISYKAVDHNPEINQISNNLSVPKRGLWWFSGYILSYQGAKKLLDKLPVVGPVDLWINHKFDELNVLASTHSIINQKLFLTSDNNYSILPVLSQIGIKSNKTFIDLEKLKGRNPVFLFDLTSNKKNLSKLELLLSLNSYRTYFNRSINDSNHVLGLIKRKETLLFDAYIGFDSIIELIPSIISYYPTVIVIILHETTYQVPEFISANGEHKIFRINTTKNITKKVSKLLKIKNWNIADGDIRLFDAEFNLNAVKTNIPFKFKYLEHDVNPWILPIENLGNYLPFDYKKHEITPIAEHLEYRFDNFIEFDLDFWGVLEDTFPSNQAQFCKKNVKLSDDLEAGFQLKITNDKKEQKEYSSASIVSKVKNLYGSFEVSMKPIKGDGIISAFFLHRNDPWQEIDIEFLGHDTTKILLNVYFNPGIENTKYNYGVRGTPVIVDLGFDASEDFHSYKIEWEYHEIRWYVDGKIIHVRKHWMPTPIPNLPLFIYVNSWITNSEELAGRFDNKILPKTTYVKHINIHKFDYQEN